MTPWRPLSATPHLIPRLPITLGDAVDVGLINCKIVSGIFRGGAKRDCAWCIVEVSKHEVRAIPWTRIYMVLPRRMRQPRGGATA